MRPFLSFLICNFVVLSFAPSIQAQKGKPAAAGILPVRKDAFGDPLPPGAIARIGTTRYRLVQAKEFGLLEAFGALPPLFSPDGSRLAVFRTYGAIEIVQLPQWERVRIIDAQSLDPKNPEGFIIGLTFSRDATKLLVQVAGQNQLHLVDLKTGKSLKMIKIPGDQRLPQFPKAVLSQDERFLCLHIHNDGTPRFVFWDLVQDKLIRSFEGPPLGNNANPISEDCRWFARNTEAHGKEGGVKYFLELWDLKSGALHKEIETGHPIASIAFSPDGKRVFASDARSTLCVYDTATGKEQHRLRIRPTPISCLSFSREGKSIYFGDNNGAVHRWTPDRDQRPTTFPAPTRCPITQFAFGSNGKLLAMSLHIYAVHLWEPETGKPLSPVGMPISPIDNLGFSPQGDLFMAPEFGAVTWWNPHTGARLREIKLEKWERNHRHIDFDPFRRPQLQNIFATMSSRGDYLLRSDGALFSAKNGKLLYEIECDSQHMAFFGSDARAVLTEGRKIHTWDPQTGRDLAKFKTPVSDRERIAHIAVSSLGKYFAIGITGDRGNRTVLWDAKQKKSIREWAESQGGHVRLTFSPDEQWLAISGVSDSPDMPVFPIQLCRLGPGGVAKPALLDRKFLYVAFSSDGRQIACVSRNGDGSDTWQDSVQIYELASKRVRLEFTGHVEGLVGSLAFSPDSSLLATGATDTTALIWETGLQRIAINASLEKSGDEGIARNFARMAGTDAKAAFQSMARLVQANRKAIQFIAEKIAPAKKADVPESTLKQWIANLGSSRFIDRNAAITNLTKLGSAAEPHLKAALSRVKDLESKRRIEQLLDGIAVGQLSQEEILHSRAVEVLEAIGTPEARALLTRWSAGEPSAVLTTESVKALKRLK